MAYVPVELLRVTAWGKTVGALAAGRRGGSVFQYDQAWLQHGIELAPNLMPIKAGEKLYSSSPVPEVFRGLPPMLADSLPDSFGNALVDAHLAQLGVRSADVSGLDRLAYVGNRGLGALEFEPQMETGLAQPTSLELAELVSAARAAVAGELTEGAPRAIQQLLSVGTSAGGYQAKAVVAWERSTGELRADSPGLPKAFEPWILKFDVSDAALGRIEYAYALMAQAAGISLPEVHLLEESGRAHFMSRRFDRVDGRKLHMQSLAAIAGMDFTLLGTHSYAQLFGQVDALGLGAAARQECFRRAAFNTLAANCDDHPKNFSFLLDEQEQWTLAPAYDLTFAWNPENPWLARHHLGIEGKYSDVNLQDLLRMADYFAVPDARETLDQVAAAVVDWPRFAATAAVPDATSALISVSLSAG